MRIPSASNAIAITALVVACSGGAFAAGSAHAPTFQTVIRTGTDVATCPSGFNVTGGGYVADGKATPTPIISTDAPTQIDPTHVGWQATAQGSAVRAYAICTRVK